MRANEVDRQRGQVPNEEHNKASQPCLMWKSDTGYLLVVRRSKHIHTLDNLTNYIINYSLPAVN